MRTIETKAYQYDELDTKAQEKARDWYRRSNENDQYWSEYVIEDFEHIAKLLGIDLRTREIGLMGGGKRLASCVYWSGFSCQGDGACFEGRYTYAPGSVKAIKNHAPVDKELHRIAEGLRDVQRQHFYKLAVTIRHYYHSHGVDIQIEDDTPTLRAGAYDTVAQLLRDLMNWLYRMLEAEYNSQQEDEYVAEQIKANEYEFDSEGKRV